MRGQAALLVVLGTLASGPSHAVPILLSELAQGGSIAQGDKRFDRFSFSPFIVEEGDVMVSLGDITVEGITTRSGHGLRFAGLLAARTVGFPSRARVGVPVRFRITTLDSDLLIDGARVELTNSTAEGGGSGAQVFASVGLRTFPEIFNQPLVSIDDADDVFDQSFESGPLIPPTTTLTASLTPVALADNDGSFGNAPGFVRIEAFEVTFSQSRLRPVPEPGSLLIVLFGLTALLSLGWRWPS